MASPEFLEGLWTGFDADGHYFSSFSPVFLFGGLLLPLSPVFSLPAFCFLSPRLTLFALASSVGGSLELGPREPAAASLPLLFCLGFHRQPFRGGGGGYGIGAFSAVSFSWFGSGALC